jgi:hypothetical protein
MMISTMQTKAPRFRWLCWMSLGFAFFVQNPTFLGDLVFSAKCGTLPISMVALTTVIVFLRIATLTPLVVYCILNKSDGWTIVCDGLVICTIFVHALSFLLVELPAVAQVFC